MKEVEQQSAKIAARQKDRKRRPDPALTPDASLSGPNEGISTGRPTEDEALGDRDNGGGWNSNT